MRRAQKISNLTCLALITEHPVFFYLLGLLATVHVGLNPFRTLNCLFTNVLNHLLLDRQALFATLMNLRVR